MNTTYSNDQPKARTKLIRNHTQEQRILEVLQSNGSNWTPAPALAAIALQYCRAIACLRKQGWTIENRVETVHGVRHGYYRLGCSTTMRHWPVMTISKTTATQEQAEMFPNLISFAPWRDPEEGAR